MDIKEKLSQNHQRRKLEDLLVKLPKSISTHVKGDKFCYRENVFSNHGLPLFPEGKNGRYIYPNGYSEYVYKEVDQLSQLSDVMLNQDAEFTKECFVSLDCDAPFIIVSCYNLKQIINNYTNCIRTNYLDLMIFQSDYKKGIVVDSYCGYLPEPERTSYDEIVYEYIYWKKEI